MFLLFRSWQYLLLLALYLGPAVLFLKQGNHGALVFVVSALVFLLAFSAVCRILAVKKVAGYQEVIDRTKTWYWMIGVFLAAMAFHRAISFAGLAFLSFSALKEYFSLLPMYREGGGPALLRRYDRKAIFLSYLAIPIMFYLAYVQWYNLYIVLVPVYVALLIPMLLALENRTEHFITSASVVLWGNLLFTFLLGHGAFIINLTPLLLFYAIFLTEGRDVIVYVFGKLTSSLVRRHAQNPLVRLYDLKIASEVSPKKNVGSALLTVFAIMGLSAAYRPLLPAFPLGRMSLATALLLGALIGIMGLVGDLVGSAFKRDLGIKDSGTALPGHGGVIDRIGSLCFTLPVVFHVCYYSYFPVFNARGF